jgi:PhzF family phenazine biosynthesis protein
MNPVTAFQVRVFGKNPDTGNSAVVVTDAQQLSDDQLQALATKAAVPDTAFVWPDATEPNRFHIRWFTPAQEVTLCGHATLAAARVLRETLPAGAGNGRIEFQSAKARLTVTQEESLSWLELPVPTNTIFEGSRNPFVEAFQIWGSETELKLPLELTPERDLIIPLSLAADLGAIEPEWDQLARLGRELKIRGICLLGRQKREKSSHFSSRFFAPHCGIPEDPATGSVQGPLALYMLKHGWASRTENPVRMIGEQGDAMGIPCRLHVEITYEGDTPSRLRVGGLTSTPIPLAL